MNRSEIAGRFPAQCTNPTCKTIFPSSIAATNVTGLTLEGNMEPCPVCGSLARIVDGTFDVKNAIIDIISAPDATKEILRAFLNIVQQTSSGKLSTEDAAKKADTVSPKFGYLLRLAAGSIPVLALLATLLQTYLQYDSNRTSPDDFKKVVDAIQAQTSVVQALAADANTAPKAAKAPSHRRTHVNRERRQYLRNRRAEFGGSRSR
jgi:hypothetical protein